MNDNHEDISLVNQTIAGDLDCFAQLIKKYERRIFRLALGVVKQVEDAEDVTQEVFIHAFRSLSTFRREASFYTWLYRIALNSALNRRSHQRLISACFDSSGIDAIVSESGSDPVCPQPTPQAVLEHRETLQLVAQILAEMPQQFAETFAMKVFEGLTYMEISNAEATSLNTVRTRIFRARQILLQESADALAPGQGKQNARA